jgi:serine/threonine protein kinase
MPPEQVAADRDATVLPTTDLFSFGAVMFFALTGQLPFGHLNDDNDLVDYMRRARDGKANLSLLKQNAENQQFVTLVSACLHPDFRRRVQTADEALALLSECESAGEQSAASDDTFEKTVRNGLLLHVMQGEDFHKVYRLNELLQGNSRIITIGRADGVSRNSIGINETLGCYISRRHCTLELDSATRRWYIRDGQWDAAASDGWRRSLNGTFVNSTEVGKDGMMISTGDIISIGEVKLRVEGY